MHRDQPRHRARLVGRNVVVVDDVQRIARLLHVQAGKGSPGAAHGIEGLAALLAQPAHVLDGVDDDALGIALARGHQPQRPNWQGGRIADAAAPDRHQLEAAATQVAHDARRVGHAAHHAVARKARLVLAAHDMRLDARPALKRMHELRTVRGVAHCRRREKIERRHFHVVSKRGEAVDIGQRHLDARRIELAGGIQSAGQAAQNLFIEHGQRRAAGALVDHEANGIRADVDDADTAMAEAAIVGQSVYGPFAVHARSL